jgi:outer membrane receptor protein involved in Fe transport
VVVGWLVAGVGGGGGVSFGEEEVLDEVVVRGLRPSVWAGEGSYVVQRLGVEELRATPRQVVDDVLRGTPGFRLFRRSGSAVAHPTTQGVSLRNTGANAASRTLVSLDGIPQNDPFGGWVPWVKVSPYSLDEVTLVRDGGVSPDGRGTMGGAIDMQSVFGRPWAFAGGQASAGEALGIDAIGTAGTGPVGPGATFSAGVRHVDFPGYPVVDPAMRGRVDTDAGHRLDWAAAALSWGMSEDWAVRAKLEAWDERRDNGTPLATNRTRAVDAGLTFTHQDRAGGPFTELAFYGQAREFESTFTAVDPGRAAERVVLDQFDVPSESAGGSLRHQWEWGRHDLTAGADSRWVRGHTNEDFRDLGDGFTRRRRAGGEQWQTGAFLLDTVDVRDGVQVALAGRLDYRRRFSAGRRETDLATGQTVLDDPVLDSGEWAASGRAGLLWDLGGPWAVRASAFTGTREPTLNELYRPFRVGDDITEANPDLVAERVYGIDLGLDWAPDDSLTVTTSAFYNRIRDSVANVTLVEGPAVVAPWGFIPDGGAGIQRQNLDAVDVAGLEVVAEWEPGERWMFSAGYLLTWTDVARATQPGLEGNQLPQIPEHQLTLGAQFNPTARTWAGAELRYVSAQQEDDLNSVELASAFTVDLFCGFRVNETWEVYASLENAFDETVETRKTSDGLTFVGAPRLWSVGVRAEF